MEEKGNETLGQEFFCRPPLISYFFSAMFVRASFVLLVTHRILMLPVRSCLCWLGGRGGAGLPGGHGGRGAPWPVLIACPVVVGRVGAGQGGGGGVHGRAPVHTTQQTVSRESFLFVFRNSNSQQVQLSHFSLAWPEFH